MATKEQAEKRVPNYPDNFGELSDTGDTTSFFGASSTDGGTNKARRSRNFPKVGKWKGNGKESRERRNTRLWESLYPTQNKTK